VPGRQFAQAGEWNCHHARKYAQKERDDMPQQQESRQHSDRVEAEQTRVERVDKQTDDQFDDLDAVLDDIESTLETNAEEYVNRFVQKGGE